MVSPWQNPLPHSESTRSRVVVYSYVGRWMPIMSSSLENAIALSRKARPKELEIVVFPPDLNPSDFHQCFNQTGLSTSNSLGNRNSNFSHL